MTAHSAGLSFSGFLKNRRIHLVNLPDIVKQCGNADSFNVCASAPNCPSDNLGVLRHPP